MSADQQATTISGARLWTGRVLSVLAGLFLLLDGGMKLGKPDFVVKPTVELGLSESVIVPLGIVLTASSILYLIPRTAVLGAILLTGYLGGAVATHMFAKHGAFEMLFPVLFGVLLWVGLVLRDERLCAIVFGKPARG